MFSTFPEDTRWNAERQAVEFGVEIGEYRGVGRVPRRVFQRLLPGRLTPERCVEAYYLRRTRSETIAQRKVRRRRLTEISGRGPCQVPIADVRRASPKPLQSTLNGHSGLRQEMVGANRKRPFGYVREPL